MVWSSRNGRSLSLKRKQHKTRPSRFFPVLFPSTSASASTSNQLSLSFVPPLFPPLTPTNSKNSHKKLKNKTNKQTIALVGAAVTGVLAHRRREEAELLNAKLRAIAGELRDRAADSAEPGACQADEDGESMRAYRMGLEQVR